MRPVIILLCGCTTLGPLPATTGVAAVPAGRPGFEAQLGVVPTAYLSDGAGEGPSYRGIATQAAILVEPDRYLSVPGLVVGGHVFGRGGDTVAEPMLGYRRRLGAHFAVAALGFATHSTGSDDRPGDQHATYTATRGGTELAVDARAVQLGRVSIHAQAAVQATAISALGTYCVDSGGVGIDCDGSSTQVDARVRGEFPAARASFALEYGRAPDWLRGRLALVVARASLPRLRDGRQVDTAGETSAGLTLTVGLGQ
jgi:hypothetical protein